MKNWKEDLNPKVSRATQNRNIKSHVRSEDMQDYQAKLKAAQAQYAVNAAPNMFLANEPIDTLTDMANRLSVHEDVLRSYLGITDDDKEQHYIYIYVLFSLVTVMCPMVRLMTQLVQGFLVLQSRKVHQSKLRQTN